MFDDTVETMIYGYIRVSTDTQTVENQRAAILAFAEKEGLHIDDWIAETISGAKLYQKRELGRLLKKVKKGDTILSVEISRLGRSLFMVMEILSICMTKGIQVWTINDGYRLGDNLTSKVLAFAFGMSAEIERSMISQRTKDALKLKREQGVKWWHDKGQRLRLNPKCAARHDWIVEQLAAGKTKVWIAKRLKVGKATLYRYLIYTGLFETKNCQREVWLRYGIFH